MECRDNVYIIGLGGGSGSGKSSVARELATLSGTNRTATVHLDDYYLHPKVFGAGPNANWDAPEALDFEGIRCDLRSLLAGHTIRTPYDSRLYELEHGNPVSKGPQIVPAEFLILEGVYAIYDSYV